MLADGSALECSPQQHAELFHTARAGIGSIGVVTEVELQNRERLPPARKRHGHGSAAGAGYKLNAKKAQHRHIEFFAFPFGNKAILKRTNEAGAEPDIEPEDDNELLELAADTTWRFPLPPTARYSACSAHLSPIHNAAGRRTGCSPARSVGFNEMEYAVPLADGPACLMEVVETIRRSDIRCFPGSNTAMSLPTTSGSARYYQRDCAVISVHQYARQDYRPLFAQIETDPAQNIAAGRIRQAAYLQYRDLRQLYPRFDDFCRVRQQADPQGKWLNAHLRQLLQEAA